MRLTVILAIVLMSGIVLSNSIIPLAYAKIIPATKSNNTAGISSSTTIPPALLSFDFKQLSGKWAKWTLEIPKSINPITDNTGSHCAQNQIQNGRFWFLVGDFGGSVNRRCTIPPGKVIFFPIVEATVTRDQNLSTIPKMQAAAKQFIDQTTRLEVSLDSSIKSGLDIHRVQSAPFRYVSPPDNILGEPPGPNIGLTEGFWVLLHPFSRGQHTIHFAGQIGSSFSLDVTYLLTIQ
jgi:hypothetical protein